VIVELQSDCKWMEFTGKRAVNSELYSRVTLSDGGGVGGR
jgi:hypothetical protein